MKLLNLQSSISQARQWRWPAWWPALPPSLDAGAQEIYQKIIARLRRDLLLLLMAVTIPLGILNGAQLGYAAFVTHNGSSASFMVHVASFLLTIFCAVTLLRRNQIGAAWGSVVAINTVAVLWQIVILREPGLLLFALLSVAGPAMFLPLPLTFALVGGLLAAHGLLLHTLSISEAQDWINVASLFAAIMVGVAFIGAVVRRVAAQSAQATVAAQAAAAEHGRLEQRVHDLQHHAQRLASLEHDLRQPLRTVEGYLTALAAERADTTELTLPALAAAQRTDRLLSNLLDQARAEAQQAPRVAQPTELQQMWSRLEHAAAGLARYYTDPPVPICWSCNAQLPYMLIDGEQIERAVLNLLDNALAHSPPDGMIEVRAQVREHEWWIEVADQGPGLPADVQFALVIGAPTASLRLGLQQVQRTLAAHNGHIAVDSDTRGTTIRLTFPLNL